MKLCYIFEIFSKSEVGTKKFGMLSYPNAERKFTDESIRVLSFSCSAYNNCVNLFNLSVIYHIFCDSRLSGHIYQSQFDNFAKIRQFTSPTSGHMPHLKPHFSDVQQRWTTKCHIEGEYDSQFSNVRKDFHKKCDRYAEVCVFVLGKRWKNFKIYPIE